MSVTHVLSLARRATEGDRFIRAGRWPEVAPGLSVRVTGKTAGILGLGYIGRRIAKRLEGGFGMRILYHGRRRVAEVSYEYYTDLRAMARDSDFLIVSCATGQATRHLVGRTELEALGSSGYLIGISRGVIQEDTLLDALAGGVIAGAGLDVFEEEPDVPAALMDMNNVVLTPHVAAMTQETKQEQMDLTIENLLAQFQKRPLLTPVT